MKDIRRVIFNNGVACFAFDSSDEVIDYVSEKKGLLIAINAEKILHATDETRAIINRNIGYADGMGAVMALKKHGCKDAVKIPGCELWLNIIERLQSSGKSFYLIGGKQSVIDETVAKLRNDYPDINIVGYRDGYIGSEAEKQLLLEDIGTAKPDVVFVAMGSPKQELLMEEMAQKHDAIYQGLGGSFDVYTGHVERAPRWWRDHNLEFAYRVMRQPAKIKRLIRSMVFPILVKMGRI